MKKRLFKTLLIAALIIFGAVSSLALTYYGIKTGAEGANTGWGPFSGYVAGSDGFTSVEVGSVVQYILAGPDRAIDPPAQDGGVTGDDELSLTTTVGVDTVWFTFGAGIPPLPNPTPGLFYNQISGTTETGAPIIVYCRVWNTSEAGAVGSFYGDSGIVTAESKTDIPPTPNDLTLAFYYTNNSFDLTPPLPPDPFTATPEADGDIFLYWTNTSEADFRATMIRFSTGGSSPTNETEGNLVTIVDGGTGESRSYTHQSLIWNQTYWYSAFSSDEAGNFSGPSTAVGTSEDTLPPLVTVVYPNGGEIFMGGDSRNITWAVTEEGNSGLGAAPMALRYSIDGGSSWTDIDTAVASSPATYAWDVPLVTTNEARISIEAVDNAMNLGMDISDADFTIDSTSPEVGSLEVRDRTDGNLLRTNEQVVSVEAFGITSEAGETLSMMVSYEASFAGSGWETFSATFEFSLTAGDGVKNVYYKISDEAGNVSNVVSDSIILDTVGPTGTSITINSGAYATNEVSVTLTLAATDEWVPLEMNISNEASYPAANWETFSTSKSWTLTAGDATKTVYVRYRDGGGNTTDASDNIIYDATPPTVEVIRPNGGEIFIGGTTENITWSATDAGSGFAGTPITIRYTSNEGTSWLFITQEANDGTYAWLIPSINSTQCRVSVEAEDRALNIGTDKSDATFTIDSSVPTVTSIEVTDRTTGDTVRTNDSTISVEAFGVSGDANEMIVSSEASFAGASWQSFTATFEYTVPSGDGTKTVYYKVRDAALQESGSVNDNIILDTSGPTGTSITINNDAHATNEVSVTLTLAATDEWVPLQMNVSNEASHPAANWESFSTSKSWTLTAGDATKTVYVRYRDGGGNTTDASDSIIYDATPPTVEVIRPNGGEIFIGGTTENITWSATDPGGSGFIGTPITIRYTSDEGATWLYIDQVAAGSSPYSWNVPLITSDECLVSIEAIDRAGNLGIDVSDTTFEVDSTRPAITAIEAKDRTTGDTDRTNERTISVEAIGESGGVQMRLAQNSGFTTNDTGWIAYQDPYEYAATTGDGTKTIYYKLRDGASRESITVEASIILDTTGPTSTSLQINGGMTATNDATVLLTMTATDEWPPLEMKISNEATLAGGVWEPFDLNKNWYLGPPDGTRTVYAGFRDGGQNESATVESDSIDLDTVSPEVTNYLPIGVNVPLTASIEVWFSKPMDKASAQAAFHMTPEVTGTFSWAGDTLMIFKPDTPLLKGLTYGVNIGPTARDTIGNYLAAAPTIWFFTPEPDTVPPVIRDYLIDGKSFPASETIRIISDTLQITANIQDEGEASGINAIQLLVDNTVVYYGTYQDWGEATFAIGGPSDGDFSVSLSALNEGTYDITVWASDYAGNISEETYADLEVHETAGVIGQVLNHPNPFSPLRGEKTAIAYTLTRDVNIAIYIYDIKGTLVWKTTCLAGAVYPNSVVGMGGRAGYNEVAWDGYDAFRRVLGNGTYIGRVAVVGENKAIGTGKFTIVDYQ